MTSCSIRDYKHVEAKVFVFKSATLKFADLAYLRHTGESIELELFVAGKVIKRIVINHLICIDEGCMRKSSFNEEYLNAAYPDELFQNILLGRKIYDAKNVVYINGGFEQYIDSENVDIKYRVDSKGIYFKDRKNAILVKLKDINR